MARWFEYMKPADYYLRYFATHDYEKTFSRARDLFLTYVVRGSWSEQRFIMSVDYVFVNRWELSHVSIQGGEDVGKIAVAEKESSPWGLRMLWIRWFLSAHHNDRSGAVSHRRAGSLRL